MHYSFAVQVPNSQYNLGSIEFHYVLLKPLLRFKYLVELPALNKRHNKVKSFWSLEQVVHANQKWMVATKQNVLLKLRVLDLVVFNQHILSYYFNRKLLSLVIMQVRKKYFSKSTPT